MGNLMSPDMVYLKLKVSFSYNVHLTQKNIQNVELQLDGWFMFKQLENRLILKYVIANRFPGHVCNLTLLAT